MIHLWLHQGQVPAGPSHRAQAPVGSAGLGAFPAGLAHAAVPPPQFRAAVLLALPRWRSSFRRSPWIRGRVSGAGFLGSFISVTLGGAIMATVGALAGGQSADRARHGRETPAE